MNNNNRGNNRRRGRGNNRQQGGQQVNRIDSRARGNAPQLLEKYRKLAHDAHLNGDRVTEEYYLQFADHYFRVLADQKQRQDESRQPRRDDRSQEYGDDYGSDDDTYNDNSSSSGYERTPRFEREPHVPQKPAEQPAEAAETGNEDAAEGERAVYEPVENPFVREGRGTRGLKERRPRRRPQDDGGDNAGNRGEAGHDAASGNLDPATLPPAISAKAPARDIEPAAEDAAPTKPRRGRPRKVVPPADDANGSFETVNS